MHFVIASCISLMLVTPGRSEATPSSKGFVKNPAIVALKAPLYPDIARHLRTEGLVVVKVALDEQGNPGDARIVRSASPALENAALAAAMRSTYAPAFGPTGPVRSVVEIPFSFRIRH